MPAIPSRNRKPCRTGREGTALIVALWVLITLSLLVGAFAYDMHIEAGITSFYRKRIKAQYLARAGVEWAKMMLAKSYEISGVEEEEESDPLAVGAINLSRGMSVTQQRLELGSGAVEVDIIPEQGRYNVNLIDDLQWVEILDSSNVPQELWDPLIDCFFDWVDENDAHLLNGAESDDSYYVERGYEVKNAPLDTINELLLIKNFTDNIVFGGPPEEEGDPPLLGIARQLTTWGDGRVNVNTAPRQVLVSLLGDELTAEAVIEQRRGLDGELGTRDDGFESVDEFMNIPGVDPAVRDRVTTTERQYVRVISIGEVQGIRNGVWCVLLGEENNILPIYWREENMQ